MARSWIESGPAGITRIGFHIDWDDIPQAPPQPHPRDLPGTQSWIEPGPPGITRIGFKIDWDAIRKEGETR